MKGTALFSAIVANGSTPGVASRLFSSEERQRRYTVYVTGTFGGASVAMEVSPDNGSTWVPLKDVNGNAVTLTAAGGVVCDMQATQMRGTVSSVSGTTSVSALVL